MMRISTSTRTEQERIMELPLPYPPPHGETGPWTTVVGTGDTLDEVELDILLRAGLVFGKNRMFKHESGYQLQDATLLRGPAMDVNPNQHRFFAVVTCWVVLPAPEPAPELTYRGWKWWNPWTW